MKIALTAAPKAADFAPIILKGRMADSFAIAADLGYDGVEIHLLKPSDVDTKEIKRLCQRYNQKIPTIGTGMAAGIEGLCFTDPDTSVRDLAVTRILEHIDLAADLGSGVTIGLIYGIIGKDPDRPETRRQAALNWAEQCCGKAGDRDVFLFLQPLNR